MTPVIRFSGRAATNIAEAINLINSINQALPLITQLVRNGHDHVSAWQQIIQQFNSQHTGQNAELHQTAPSASATPTFWYQWDASCGRYRVATYDAYGNPVWASN